ncbi:4Fe-4S dicluster domain-containing protein [bacterium]
MIRIGVFICHCGTNIGGVVDIPSVTDICKDFPYVQYVTDYKYLCSQPGQDIISDVITDQKLTHVVVGSCSPRMHEKTFQKAISKAGLNPHLLHIVNLREHCSWVHKDRQIATQKATELMEAGIRRVVYNSPLFTKKVSINRKALVIGGGVAGIQAALDIANSGFKVILVERQPSIGGRMAQLDKTFPTLDCSACILTPKMVEAASHPNIELKTYAEITNVSGSVGNFNVTIKNKARYVNSSCTGCGDCFHKCPMKKDSEFNEYLNKRKAIYIPFPQAVPTKAVIDKSVCLYFKTGKCRLCETVCEIKAIDFDMQDVIEEAQVGTIIAATGYDLFDHSLYGEYGAGKYKNIISSIELERMFSSSGPTNAKILVPQTEKTPKNIVFIQCVGSRDDKKGKTYCSKICCMYTAKHTILIKEKMPDAKISVFYIDVRTAGKSYEEFFKRAQMQDDVSYIRGRVSKLVKRPNGNIKVMGVDTLSNDTIEVEADLVVLSTAVVAKSDAHSFSQILGIPTDKDTFFNEAHPKLRPVETQTAGIFLAGACQGPKDIPETVAFASGAASKVMEILSQEYLESQPMTSVVREEDCSGCFTCIDICPYKAIEEKLLDDGRKIAFVKDELCQGCGACAAHCKSSALDLKGFNNNMILAEIISLCQ